MYDFSTTELIQSFRTLNDYTVTPDDRSAKRQDQQCWGSTTKPHLQILGATYEVVCIEKASFGRGNPLGLCPKHKSEIFG